MRKKLFALFVLGLILVWTGTALAQESATVVAGDRVRVSVPDIYAKPIVGTVVTLGPDSLVLQREDSVGTTAVALSAVEKLEVARGKKRNLLNGMALGFALGAGIGIVAVSGEDGGGDITKGEEKVIVGGFLGIVGGILGGVAGFFAKTDRWEEVPLEKIQANIELHGDNGLKVSLSFTF